MISFGFWGITCVEIFTGFYVFMSRQFLSSDNFHVAFAELSALLCRYQLLWRDSPFVEDSLPWLELYPELGDTLLGLSDEQLSALDDESLLLSKVAAILPQAHALTHWAVKPYVGDVEPMPKFVDVGIRGAKVAQITGFASACKAFLTPSDKGILDWCSGKGHLAKQLHHVTGARLTCLEYNDYLCQCGTAEAQKHNFPITFVQQDVLKPIAASVLHELKHHTALHACGDLHLAMIDTALANAAEQLVLSPCCYHLTADEIYQQRSLLGKSCPLRLSKSDLRLAVSQFVTGGQRVRRLRRQELVWRIGFDLLHRQISGCDRYRPTPSMAKQWLSGDFTQFCHLMAERIGIDLPFAVDSEQWLLQAERKYHRVSRLEKARLAFREAMELYLVLDRALHLQEHGYEVTLQLFCSSQTTPRNIMMIASKV